MKTGKLMLSDYENLAKIALYDFLKEINNPSELMCDISANLNKELYKKLGSNKINTNKLVSAIQKQIIKKIKSVQFYNKLKLHCQYEREALDYEKL